MTANLNSSLRKILLVDDDSEFIAYFLSLTEPYNLTFDVCHSLMEAQQKIVSSTYDAYIINLNLPDGFGLDLIQEIRSKEHCQNPIAVTSAIVQDEQMAKLLKEKYSIDYIFNKPIYPQQLDKLLIKLCSQNPNEKLAEVAAIADEPGNDPAAALSPSMSRLSLYIVDSDAKFLELLQRGKEEFAIDLVVESSPEKALIRLQSPEFNPRIIIASLSFHESNISAFDLIEAVRKKPGAISTIFSIILEEDSIDARIEAIKKGVVYVFYKPVSAHALLKTMAEALEIGSLRDFKALILEEDLDICRFILSALSEVGIEAQSINKASSLFQTMKEYAPDLLFLDIDLPAYDGFNLLKTLRAETVYQNLLVIIITERKWSYAEEADTELNSYSGNADGILYKPLNKKILQKCVVNLAKRTTLLKLSTVQSRIGLNVFKTLLKKMNAILASPSSSSYLVLFRIDHSAELVLQHGQGVVNEFMILVSNTLQRIEDSVTSCYFFASTFAILFTSHNENAIEKKLFDLLSSIQSQSNLNTSFSCSIVPVSQSLGNSQEVVRTAEKSLKEASDKGPAPIKIVTYLLGRARSNKKSLMLIESNKDLLLILKTAFDSQNLTIKTFSEGKPALQELLSCNEAQLPALIIAERKLPDMDGIEILKGLNTRFKSPVPFYFLTDFAAEKDVTEGLKYGALEYITKPFNLSHLIQKSLKTIFERAH